MNIITEHDYLIIRKYYMDLTQKILWYEKDKKRIMLSARELKLFKNNTIVFESEEETNVLFDYILYEHQLKGKKLIEAFLETNPLLNPMESQLIQSMKENYYSLFQIEVQDKEKNLVILSDLLNKKKYNLIDKGLSATGIIGLIVSTRLIPLPHNCYMTSGNSFSFLNNHKDFLLSEYEINCKNMKRKLNSTELILLLFKYSRRIGIDLISTNVVGNKKK
jgi:hypothetical protein